jgi:hypothetical protein
MEAQTGHYARAAYGSRKYLSGVFALMGAEPTTRHGFNTGFSKLETAANALSSMPINYGWEFSALLRSFSPTISIMGSDGEGRKPTAS